MAVKNVVYECSACGATLRFNPEKGQLTCDFCDSAYTPEQAEAYMAQKLLEAEEKAAAQAQEAASGGAPAAKGAPASKKERRDQRAAAADTDAYSGAASDKDVDPIQAYLNSKRQLKEDEEGTTAVECKSCGATLIVSDVSAVTCCPYCGNNAIVPGKLGSTLEPDYLIPFKTTKADAIARLKNHYQGKICLPKAFAGQNHVEEIQGVYVPFWLYDGSCSGEADFVCTNVRVFDDGDYEVTETDTWHVHRAGSSAFEQVPADASKRMPNDHMDSIEPYDYSDMIRYSPAYLPGFAAERYDDDVRDCAGRIKTRMAKTVHDELRSRVGVYSTVSCTRQDSEERVSGVSYALLPVWMLHTRWEDKDFLFAMNGQTGKFVGDLPVDKKKLNLLTLAALGIGFAVAFAGTFFFLG